MSYRMYRVFCATPSDSESDLESERQAFYEVVGQVNECEGVPLGILLVPVSILPNMTSLDVFRPSIDANVRACKFFVQVLDHTWGAPTRDFELSYQLGKECCAGVSVFFKAPNGRPVQDRVTTLRESLSAAAIDFDGPENFKAQLHAQLSIWLQSVTNS